MATIATTAGAHAAVLQQHVPCIDLCMRGAASTPTRPAIAVAQRAHMRHAAIQRICASVHVDGRRMSFVQDGVAPPSTPTRPTLAVGHPPHVRRSAIQRACAAVTGRSVSFDDAVAISPALSYQREATPKVQLSKDERRCLQDFRRHQMLRPAEASARRQGLRATNAEPHDTLTIPWSTPARGTSASPFCTPKSYRGQDSWAGGNEDTTAQTPEKIGGSFVEDPHTASRRALFNVVDDHAASIASRYVCAHGQQRNHRTRASVGCLMFNFVREAWVWLPT